MKSKLSSFVLGGFFVIGLAIIIGGLSHEGNLNLNLIIAPIGAALSIAVLSNFAEKRPDKVCIILGGLAGGLLGLVIYIKEGVVFGKLDFGKFFPRMIHGAILGGYIGAIGGSSAAWPFVRAKHDMGNSKLVTLSYNLGAPTGILTGL